jgi:hypothetical protein
MPDNIFPGMSRPPVPPTTAYVDTEGVVRYAGILVCPCGQHLRYKEGVREHWSQGHFDTPIYASRAEMLQAKAKLT